ncbi:hypothetical protein ACFP76_17675 [Paracoccus aerius]|uniref:hypothetical protein n=1 Tax=Paracoccus aerius TaxID=1915382 RepID=UPI003613E5AD
MDLPQGLSRGIKSVLGLQTFRREKIERQSRAFDLTEGFVFMHGAYNRNKTLHGWTAVDPVSLPTRYTKLAQFPSFFLLCGRSARVHG